MYLLADFSLATLPLWFQLVCGGLAAFFVWSVAFKVEDDVMIVREDAQEFSGFCTSIGLPESSKFWSAVGRGDIKAAWKELNIIVRIVKDPKKRAMVLAEVVNKHVGDLIMGAAQGDATATTQLKGLQALAASSIGDDAVKAAESLSAPDDLFKMLADHAANTVKSAALTAAATAAAAVVALPK